MKASQVLALGALAAPALAQNRTEIVTITNTAYTTYCPVPTTIPIGNMTYTVSKATTLTITNCPCTLTKTGWFKPTPTTQPQCPGGENCSHGGDNGGNGGNGGGQECSGKDCGNNGSNGGNGGGNGGSPGCNGKDCGNNGGNGGNPGNTGGNGGNGDHSAGSGSPTSTPQAGCDEKTGAGCPADQTVPGVQPTGSSVVVAGANVNGLSAGAVVVAGLAALML